MNTLPTLLALGSPDRQLLIEAARLFMLVRVGMLVVPFPTLHAWLRRGRRFRPHYSLVRLVWAVNAIARRWPGTTCLMDALVMECMLIRHGYAPTLKIGVRPGAPLPDAAPLAAHAWVECDGRVVFGVVEQLGEYAVLS